MWPRGAQGLNDFGSKVSCWFVVGEPALKPRTLSEQIRATTQWGIYALCGLTGNLLTSQNLKKIVLYSSDLKKFTHLSIPHEMKVVQENPPP